MILETWCPNLCPFKLEWVELDGYLNFYYVVPPPEVEAAIRLMMKEHDFFQIKGHEFVVFSGIAFGRAVTGGSGWDGLAAKAVGL